MSQSLIIHLFEPEVITDYTHTTMGSKVTWLLQFHSVHVQYKNILQSTLGKQCGCLGWIRQAHTRHEIERGVVTVRWS